MLCNRALKTKGVESGKLNSPAEQNNSTPMQNFRLSENKLNSGAADIRKRKEMRRNKICYWNRWLSSAALNSPMEFSPARRGAEKRSNKIHSSGSSEGVDWKLARGRRCNVGLDSRPTLLCFRMRLPSEHPRNE